MNTEAPLRWYCLRARLKREHFAALQLAERTGVETFAPRLAIRRPRVTGGVVVATEALFPGYLLARFRLPNDSRFVLSTPDVTGLVHFGDHTPAVPEPLIELLRTHATGTQPCVPVLAPGDWIEVLTGCLAGSQGRIVTFDSGRSRAWVLLALLGQDLRVCLPTDALRRTGPASLDFPPELLAPCG